MSEKRKFPKIISLNEFVAKKTKESNEVGENSRQELKAPIKLSDYDISEYLEGSEIRLSDGRVQLLEYENAESGNRFIFLGEQRPYLKPALIALRNILFKEQDFDAFIVQDSDKLDIPEVSYIDHIARKTGKQVKNIFISPYNKKVLELADVRYKDAVLAVIFNEFSQYTGGNKINLNEQIMLIDDYVTKNMGIHSDMVFEFYRTRIGNLDQKHFFEMYKKGIDIYNKLLDVSKSLSWCYLQEYLGEAGVSKKFLAMAREDYSEIFNPEFKPTVNYLKQKTFDRIKKDIDYNKNVRRLDRRDSWELLLGFRDMMRQKQELEKQLDEINDNNKPITSVKVLELKSRYKNLILDFYDDFMDSEDFYTASKTMELALKYKIKGIKRYLCRALEAYYHQLIEKQDYYSAVAVASRLLELSDTSQYGAMLNHAEELYEQGAKKEINKTRE